VTVGEQNHQAVPCSMAIGLGTGNEGIDLSRGEVFTGATHLGIGLAASRFRRSLLRASHCLHFGGWGRFGLSSILGHYGHLLHLEERNADSWQGAKRLKVRKFCTCNVCDRIDMA
jgi:hypothetical protein